MPEVYLPVFRTTTTAPLTASPRPTTINVAATQVALGASLATFSIMIYDVGSDASPTHAEAFEITAGGSTLVWTGTNEAEWTPTTHASGSTVIVTTLTPRSLIQPLTNHANPAVIANPHSIYVLGSNYTAKGDVIVGTGAGTYQKEAVGTTGFVLTADPTSATGRSWQASGAAALLSVMTHMGDLIVGGLLGAAGRFGIGSVGTILAVAQNTPAVPTPGFGPICSATGSGGLLVNGTLYDFTYAWQTPNASPDGGITASGPITVFTATSTGVVSVQCAAAPTSGLTLVVYGALHGGTLTQQTTLFPTSTITTNTVTISNIVLGALTSGSNTSGGLGFVWSPASITGPTGATGTPGPAGVSSTTVSGASPYFCAQEQQPSGTSGGTFTAGSWQVRTVNTILANDPAIAAKLSANTITLPSGTFRTVISTPAYRVNRHAARLQNTSANTVALPGSSEEAFDTGTGGSTTRSIIHGRFSLAVTSTLQIQHQCETTSATDGFGRNTGSAFAVAQEVYTVAEFWLEGGTIPFFGTTFQNPSLGNISTQRYIGIIAQAIPIARSLTAKPFLLPTFENPSLDLLAARRQDATTSITSSINNNNILPV